MTIKSILLLLLHNMANDNLYADLHMYLCNCVLFRGIVFLFSSVLLLHHDLVFLGSCLCYLVINVMFSYMEILRVLTLLFCGK